MNKKLLIDRFLSWPLPESLCSDPCASRPGYPHRTGTNLMTAEHAAAMIEHVIAAPRQPEGDGLEVVAYMKLNSPIKNHTDFMRHETWMNDGLSDGWVSLVHLSDAHRAIAELREELNAAKEILAQQGRRNTELRAERDTLRQQLAEARDEISQHSNDLALTYMKGGADMRQQRDKLADILRDLVPGCKWRFMRPRIDAALAEIDHDNE